MAAVELRGADFDWDNWAGLPPDQLAVRRAATAALVRDEVRQSLFRRLWDRATSCVNQPTKPDCKPTKGAAHAFIFCRNSAAQAFVSMKPLSFGFPGDASF